MTNKTALFGALDSGPTISDIAVSDIRPDPDQPRKTIDSEALQELADSIEQHGLVQPIVVRKDPDAKGKFLITAGERRFRAVGLLNRPTIAAIIRNEGNAAVVSIIENLQRVDLSPIEEAEAVSRLINEQKLSQSEAGKLVGMKRPTLNQLMSLNNLPSHIREGARTVDVSKSILIELAVLTDQEQQLKLWARAKDGNLTVAEIRKLRKPKEIKQAADKQGVGRPTPIIKPMGMIDKGVSALQAQPLSEDERTEILEMIDRLNAITGTKDKTD
jgi:ParB family chromosome partitioning protein